MKNKFKGQVFSYEWEDHHAPTIGVLFEVCYDMYHYLAKDERNVVVVHCNAGKGRTGTCIASYFLYSKMMSTAEEAIRYYGEKRFEHGIGITQPCQLRYVKYFEDILGDKVMSPNLKILKGLKMYTIPNIKRGSCKPYVEIVQISTMKLIYCSKKHFPVKKYKASKRKESSGASDFLPRRKKATSSMASNKSSHLRFTEVDMHFDLDAGVTRKSTANFGDRKSLFDFDSTGHQKGTEYKRRSNSMGKEEATKHEEEEEEKKTGPTTNSLKGELSKEIGSHKDSKDFECSKSNEEREPDICVGSLDENSKTPSEN